MIHQPSGGASGHATDFDITAKEILRMRAALTGIYERHCKLEGEGVEECRERFGEYLLGLLLLSCVGGRWIADTNWSL